MWNDAQIFPHLAVLLASLSHAYSVASINFTVLVLFGGGPHLTVFVQLRPSTARGIRVSVYCFQHIRAYRNNVFAVGFVIGT